MLLVLQVVLARVEDISTWRQLLSSHVPTGLWSLRPAAVKAGLFVSLALRELQLSNEQLVESMDNGSNPPTNRRPKYVQIDQKLQQYTDRLINGEITRLAFLKKVAFKLKQAS